MLPNGVHPETGEVVERDGLYQDPQAVRALHRAITALEFQQQRERARGFLPANAGKTWSDFDDCSYSADG
jgi:hypothetical protein